MDNCHAASLQHGFLIGDKMKIVGCDNFARETVADYLVAENIKNKEFAELMCKALNEKYCNNDYASTHYQIKEDNYRLSCGMEDLI